MHAAIGRHIRSRGRSFSIQNATGGGGRDTPSYSDDGTLAGILERRGLPRTVKDSDGVEVEADLEIRTIAGSATIREAGSTGGYPTKLISGPLFGDSYGSSYGHGTVYRVLNKHTEDGGVTVLTVVED